MRVRIPATTLGTYPDLVVVCGDLKFDDEKGDTLTNPTLLLEVLSLSTADYDRGKKFAHYRTLPSLTTYIMASQDEISVEFYQRQAANRWVFSEYRNLNDVLDLPTLGAKLSLAEIYAAVPAVGPLNSTS
jgi:Uma2 family endonuclease